MRMPRHLVHLPAILAAGFAAGAAQAAEKSHYNCRSGEIVRRVVIEVGDLATSLPCEVVYWKDTEAPGVRRVLWNAKTDAGFCDDKAAGLVDKLATSGWQCDLSGAGAPTEQAAVAPASQPAGTDSSADSESVSSLDAAAPQPSATPLPSNATEGSSTTPSWADPAARSNETETAAIEPAAAPPSPVITEQLRGVIAQNLESLNKSVDGDFEAEVGQFGDLNADGLDDAVVFFNYQSSNADYTQFVAAYLFNGDSYHLAATKPVGGTDRAIEKVEVEDIVNGSILLRLQLNDASQTEDRRAAMTLKDGQLIEIE